MASTSIPDMVSACASSRVESCGLTKVRSQFSENFMQISPRRRRDAEKTRTDDPDHLNFSAPLRLVELFEEAQIVFDEKSQIVHAVAQHREAIRAQAEGEALVLFAVDPHVPQHVGMDHARAPHFELAFAEAHVDLGGGLGKRE